MIGFSNMFKAEIYKLAKLKTLLKILIAIVIVFVVSTLLYLALVNAVGGLDMALVDPEEEITPETVEKAELASREYEEKFEAENASVKMVDTERYTLKSKATLYRYMYDNGMTFDSYSEFGSMSSSSANSYIIFIMGIMSTVMLVFASVSIIKSIAGERANGTLKMQLLRPVSKEAMLVAKFTAVYVVSLGLYIFTFLLTCVVGICAFNVDAKQIIAVIDATHVAVMSPAAMIIIYLVYYATTIFAYTALGTCLSCLLKKGEALPIVITMIIAFLGDGIERMLGYAFIGYAGFAINISWLNALTRQGPVLSYMGLYSMIPIACVWVFGMLAISWFTFRKAEIHS